MFYFRSRVKKIEMMKSAMNKTGNIDWQVNLDLDLDTLICIQYSRYSAVRESIAFYPQKNFPFGAQKSPDVMTVP